MEAGITAAAGTRLVLSTTILLTLDNETPKYGSDSTSPLTIAVQLDDVAESSALKIRLIPPVVQEVVLVCSLGMVHKPLILGTVESQNVEIIDEDELGGGGVGVRKHTPYATTDVYSHRYQCNSTRASQRHHQCKLALGWIGRFEGRC
jgi:hypothetical protein